MDNKEDKRNRNYYGRYCHSTGFFTRPDGKRFKCTWEEYLDWIGRHRGLEVAHRIKMRHVKYQESKAKKADDKKVKIKLNIKK